MPLALEADGLGRLIVEKLELETNRCDLSEWQTLVDNLKEPHEPVNIALVGKYVELNDAYYSVRESIYHAGLFHNRDINMIWVPSESLDSENLVGNNLARISCFWVRNRTPTPTPTNRISKIEYFL